MADVASQSDVKIDSPPPAYSSATAPSPGDQGGATPYPAPQGGYQPYPQGPPGQMPYPPAQGAYPSFQEAYPPYQQQYPQQYTSAQVGYNPNQPNQVTVQPTRTVVVQQQPQQPGDCPICKGGPVVPQFTCCGIMMGIVFFPFGLICCLAMRRPVCTNCGAQL